MTDSEPESPIHHGRREKGALSHKLDAIGWGLFFIWMGIAFLLDVGWGWGMVGIAVIIDLESPGNHLQGGRHVGFGRVGAVGDFPKPL